MIHAIHNNHNHPIKTTNGLYIPKFATIYVDDEGKVVDPLADKPTYDDSDLKARISVLENSSKSGDTSISDALAEFKKQVIRRYVALEYSEISNLWGSQKTIGYKIPTDLSKEGFTNYNDFVGEGIITIVENWTVSHVGGGAGGTRSCSFYYTLQTGSNNSSVAFPLFDNSAGNYSVNINPDYITIKTPGDSSSENGTTWKNSVSSVRLLKL